MCIAAGAFFKMPSTTGDANDTPESWWIAVRIFLLEQDTIHSKVGFEPTSNQFLRLLLVSFRGETRRRFLKGGIRTHKYRFKRLRLTPFGGEPRHMYGT